MRIPDDPSVSPDSVTWWGHSTTTVDVGGVRLLTDPLLRGHLGPLRWHAGHEPAPLDRHVSAVLVSHLHHDHLDIPSLGMLPAGTTVVTPAGAVGLVKGLAGHRVRELRAGEELDVDGITVTAVHAEHDGRRHPFGGSAPALGYLVRGRGRVVWFAGDTDLYPEMESLRAEGIGVALVPVGGWGLTLGEGHLDPNRAARAVALARPAVALPIHWGSLRVPLIWRVRSNLFNGSGAEFARAAARLAPDVRVALVAPGTPVPLDTSSED